MFNVGEVINTDTGEEVKILQFLSDINGTSVYKVRIDQDTLILRWFEKELYKDHFIVIERICKEKWPKEFVLPVKVFRVKNKDVDGFGYIEPFVSEEYRDAFDYFRSSSDKQATRFTTYQAMLQACLNISVSVQRMLLKGYSFRDGIHPGHFTIHPATGEVYIIGLEELILIGSEGAYGYGPANRLVQYSAPECIETNQSSIESDSFSLAILLYRLIFIDHPFEGALRGNVALITRDVKKLFWREKEVFHLDPNNDSNRPTDIYAPNVLIKWNTMPLELRNSFIRVFTEGIRDPQKRLIAGQWVQTLISCRNKLIRLNEKREHFVNFEDVRTIPPRCLGLKVDGQKIALYPQKAIYSYSIRAGMKHDSIIAGVLYRRDIDSLMIKNMTADVFRVWSPETKQVSTLTSGDEYPLSPGVMIEFQKENPRIVGEIFDVRIRKID